MPAAPPPVAAMIGWWVALDQPSRDLGILLACFGALFVFAFWPRRGRR